MLTVHHTLQHCPEEVRERETDSRHPERPRRSRGVVDERERERGIRGGETISMGLRPRKIVGVNWTI